MDRFNNNGSGLITAYYMDYDLLSRAQDLAANSLAPSALGKRIKLDSQYDTQVTVGWGAIAGSVAASFLTPTLAGTIVTLAGSNAILKAMFQCHKCPELLYGFLVKEGSGGSIVEDLLGL